MSPAPLDEAVRARIVKVLREDPELTAELVAARFGVAKSAVARLRTEAGLTLHRVRMYPRAQAKRRFRFPRVASR